MAAMAAAARLRGFWACETCGDNQMYEKPTLQRFGTFREITLAGVEFGYGDPGGGYWKFEVYSPPTDYTPPTTNNEPTYEGPTTS
jgi:hypothetical protein